MPTKEDNGNSVLAMLFQSLKMSSKIECLNFKVGDIHTTVHTCKES